MLGFEFKGLTDLQKGYLSLLFGSVLLMHTLNIFREWLNGMLVLAAIALIIYGIAKTHLVQTAFALIQKETEKSEPIDVTPEEKE